MSEQQVRQLLKLGIVSLKQGDKDKARRAFLAVVKLDPTSEPAWIGLLSAGKDSKEQLTALKRLLEINPDHPKALETLDRAGLTREQLLGKSVTGALSEDMPQPSPTPAVPDDVPPWLADSEELQPEEPAETSVPAWLADDDDDDFSFGQPESEVAEEPDAPELPPWLAGDEAYQETLRASSQGESTLPPPRLDTEGVPIPEEANIQAAIAQAQATIADYLEATQIQSDIEWAKKDKRRAGERAIWRWRAQVATMILIPLILLGGGAWLFITTNPEAQKLVFAPTASPTITPSVTPTNTPGITPTASSTPDPTFTPTPTFDLFNQAGDPRVQPRPTQPYSPVTAFLPEGILEARDLIEAGELQEAFAILQNERDVAEPGDPYPYYLMSKIDLRRDDPESALLKLQEGFEASDGSPRRDAWIPLYDLGFGEVALYQAEEALARGDTRGANNFLDDAQERFDAAIAGDNSLIDAYIALSESHLINEDYDAALTVLNVPLQGEFAETYYTDERLRAAKANVFLAQGEYELALQEANELIFFHPYSEDGYRLQVETALTLNRPGLANLYLEGYQLFYPGSVYAFRLQGDAYVQEGKSQQALNAYDRALLGDEDDPAYLDALRARGELYFNLRRYDLAREDFSSYLAEDDDPEVRALRMQSAYLGGNYAIAQRDTDELMGSGVLSDSALLLLQAQILVDQADSGDDEDYQQALNLLSQAVGAGLETDLRPTANDYLAQAHFQLGNFDQALNAINQSLNIEETGSRHYLRGLILEAQEDFVGARADYEWVLTWSSVYPYTFRVDAEERYEEMTERIADSVEGDASES